MGPHWGHPWDPMRVAQGPLWDPNVGCVGSSTGPPFRSTYGTPLGDVRNHPWDPIRVAQGPPWDPTGGCPGSPMRPLWGPPWDPNGGRPGSSMGPPLGAPMGPPLGDVQNHPWDPHRGHPWAPISVAQSPPWDPTGGCPGPPMRPLWGHPWDPNGGCVGSSMGPPLGAPLGPQWGTSRNTPGTPIGDTPGPPLALLRAPRGTPLGTSRAAHGTLPLLTHSPRAERTLSPHDPPEAPITPPAPPPGPMEGAVPPPGCSAISGGGGARRERRWVKYDGIGPVDETGLPLASRSSVDRPRDWYRCMFQQIHCRLPEPEWDAQCCATAQPRSEPPAAPPALPNGTERTPWGDGGDTAEPGSVFAYEPGALNGAPHRGAGCAHRDPISPPQPPGAVPAVPPIEVQLQRELEQLSAELDEDIRAMERPQRMAAARLKFDFRAESPRELSLRRGDVVLRLRAVDSNWLQGEHRGRVGIFPRTYVELLPPGETPRPRWGTPTAPHGCATAAFSFRGELPVELSCRRGERLSLLRRVDAHWYEGCVVGTAQRGIVPRCYLRVHREPGGGPTAPQPTAPQPTAPQPTAPQHTAPQHAAPQPPTLQPPTPQPKTPQPPTPQPPTPQPPTLQPRAPQPPTPQPPTPQLPTLQPPTPQPTAPQHTAPQHTAPQPRAPQPPTPQPPTPQLPTLQPPTPQPPTPQPPAPHMAAEQGRGDPAVHPPSPRHWDFTPCPAPLLPHSRPTAANPTAGPREQVSSAVPSALWGSPISPYRGSPILSYRSSPISPL
uniref:Sorbin and SH3 domain containing 3 n=1 Tax=Gallus gallus TaxID=9031 RepID=A0A8V0ZC79_CHICK